MDKDEKANILRGRMFIIFGPALKEERKEALRELAKTTGEKEDDIHYELTCRELNIFIEKKDGQSGLDKIFSIILEKEVRIKKPNVTWALLEGARWPAVEIYEDDIYTLEGELVKIDFTSKETKEKIIKERIIPCFNHVFDFAWIKVLTSKAVPGTIKEFRPLSDSKLRRCDSFIGRFISKEDLLRATENGFDYLCDIDGAKLEAELDDFPEGICIGDVKYYSFIIRLIISKDSVINNVLRFGYSSASGKDDGSEPEEKLDVFPVQSIETQAFLKCGRIFEDVQEP